MDGSKINKVYDPTCGGSLLLQMKKQFDGAYH